MTSPSLRGIDLNKRYGVVQALKDVSLTLYPGQTHAIVGSNGAGKSTLVKIMTGVVVPDSGVVEIKGQSMPLGSPRAALNAGLACIYQHPNLVPELSVADNIMLGHHPTGRFGLLDRRALRKNVLELLQQHHLYLNPDTPVAQLSSVQQKEVEIAKALSLNASIILMDEPTAALSHAEVEKLFDSIKQLCRQGVAVLYISHILDEIFQIAQYVTVMRDGQVRLTEPIEGLTKSRLVDAMLGRELSSEIRHTFPHEVLACPVALECRNLDKRNAFQKINLQVRAGEIVCITGLIGAKRTELVRAIFGADPADSGEIWVWGRQVKIRRPVDAIRLGIGFVPEDRHQDGLFLSLSIGLNMMMSSLKRVTRMGMLFPHLMNKMVKEQIEKVEIKPSLPNYIVRNLSGGNQQKVQLARWLVERTRILILDEPTVGIDVGTKATIYRLLRELSAQGTAVMVVSSDIEEVLTLADRVLVMARGRIAGEFLRQEATQEKILAAAGGEMAQATT
jgi:ABC-type sugar transport system ATPase subunit